MKKLSITLLIAALLFTIKIAIAQNPDFSNDESNAFESANGASSYMGSGTVIDKDRNINVITTYFGHYGLAIAKYDPSGQLLNQFLLKDIIAASIDDGNYKGLLLMDNSNNYYVLGEESTSSQTLKMEKISSKGKLLWSYVFGSSSNTTRGPATIMDPTGNIY